MRQLKDLVDEVLGRRWTPGGRGPLSFDCLGLFLWLVRENRGIEIDDPFPEKTDDPGAVAKRFAENFVELSDYDQARALDLWHLLGIGGFAGGNHLFVIEDSRWLVHTQFGTVARAAIRDFLGVRGIRRYRLKVLADGS
jgi:hypothetical protein